MSDATKIDDGTIHSPFNRCMHKAECQRLARENELLRAAVRDVVRYSGTNAYESFKSRHAEAIKIAARRRLLRDRARQESGRDKS